MRPLCFSVRRPIPALVGYSQQPGKVLRVPSLLILLGSLGVVALIFGAAVVIILRTRRSNYTIIYG